MNPTLTRLRRLLVMVPWLIEHPGVEVDEVAARFGTTAGAVVEDLDVLGYCGLPGYGGGDLIDATVTGGRVTVRMAEFFSRPLALSVREGLALLLAARAVVDSGALTEAAGPLRSAITKLQVHLGGEADLPVALDVEAGGADLLSRLLPAVEEPRVVQLRYRSASKGETTVRDVEPWALRRIEGAWYLQGWCRSAAGARSFRLDRILDLVVSDEEAPAPPEDPPRPPVYEPREDDPVVELLVDPAASWVTDHIAGLERHAADDGRLHLRFRVADLSWAATLVLRLGGSATVVTPPALALEVRARAERVLAIYAQG